MRLRTLRQRFLVLLLLPVLLLLGIAGLVGFWQLHERLLEQWRESALFSLEEAAHVIDMRLARPGETLKVVADLQAGRELPAEQWQALLAKVPGVVRAKVEPEPSSAADGAPEMAPHPGGRGPSGGLGRGMGLGMGDPGAPSADAAQPRGRRGMRFQQVRPAQVAGPEFSTAESANLVTLSYQIQDDQGRPSGKVELIMALEFFLEGLQALHWWQTSQVLLVDRQGRILTSHGYDQPRSGILGQNGDPLESQTLAALRQSDSGTLLSGHPARRVSGFFALKLAPWRLVLTAPGDRVLAPVFSFLAVYGLALVFSLGCVGLIILAVTRGITKRVAVLGQAAARVSRGDYAEVEPDECCDEVGQLAMGFNLMLAGLRERDYIKDTFGRYVDEEVARKLMSRPEARRLGGEQRSVAILLTDVRGFTQVCERLSPEQTIAVVNRYLEGIINAIQGHQGIIVDFLGDAALAFFDTLDQPIEQAVRRALCCSLEVRQASQDFNCQARQEGLPELATAIALNAGEVVVGNIGSKARTKYGIVGGPVNLTARLQTLAEGGEIIVSDQFLALAGPAVKVEKSLCALVKGFPEPVNAHVVSPQQDCGLVMGDDCRLSQLGRA
ncbi:MAG: HAMP domain-containing protein [Desulfarculus sp.]|nr:HAMP domain-containing protein [Desulfarculus sp.]